MKCVRCSTVLEPDPFNPHWSHCPVCSPEWVVANRRAMRLFGVGAMATRFAADQRGRPRIGGVKK